MTFIMCTIEEIRPSAPVTATVVDMMDRTVRGTGAVKTRNTVPGSEAASTTLSSAARTEGRNKSPKANLERGKSGDGLSEALSNFVLLILVVLAWWYINRKMRAEKKEKSRRLRRKQLSAQVSQDLWRTTDWAALYGLLSMTFDGYLESTPFRDEHVASIRGPWQQVHRVALRRLLQRGIIPLSIYDGGLSTHEIRGWGWQNNRLILPLYRRATTRAYFEFLIPSPNGPKRQKFLQILLHNDREYGVSMRCGESSWNISGTSLSARTTAYHCVDRPFSVGAVSIIKWLLPFMPVAELEQSEKYRLHELSWFFRGQEAQNVPLLHYNASILVRVESNHWGHEELDQLVCHVSQDAKLNDNWLMEETELAARAELETCGIMANGQ